MSSTSAHAAFVRATGEAMNYSELMRAYLEYCKFAHTDPYWMKPYAFSPGPSRPPIEWPSRGPLAQRMPKLYGAVSLGSGYVMRHTLPVIDARQAVMEFWK